MKKIHLIILASLLVLNLAIALSCSVPPESGLPVEWVHQLNASGQSDDVANAVDGNGYVYVAGFTSGAFSGQTNLGGSDAFVTKCDAGGNELWVKQLGTAGDDVAKGVSVYSTEVYVVGYTSGALSGQTNLGGSDAFVVKYDASGNELWTKQLGTALNDYANGVSADSSGIYVAGITFGAFAGHTGSGGSDGFVIKYDASGNELWTGQFGTDGTEFVWAVYTDSEGVYIAGYTSGSFPGETSAMGYDAFVQKYDFSGTRSWAHQFGTSSDDYAKGIFIDSNGLFIAGSTLGTFPGQTSAQGYDLFIAKLTR